MSTAFATADLRSASERFKGFFEELSRAFVERDDLLAQIALALLSREHVLMTGPPGTAKSGVAAAVVGRIVNERTGDPSVFSRQFTESTVQTDLVGPIDFKTRIQTGHTEHFTDEGMLGTPGRSGRPSIGSSRRRPIRGRGDSSRSSAPSATSSSARSPACMCPRVAPIAASPRTSPPSSAPGLRALHGVVDGAAGKAEQGLR